ncbi:unnamed protein product, partial [Adineta steineri]
EKPIKISEIDNELTRRISTVVETSVTTTTEQERDLRRHSHIGSFQRGISIDQNEIVTTTVVTKTTEKS